MKQHPVETVADFVSSAPAQLFLSFLFLEVVGVVWGGKVEVCLVGRQG
jgi:hypothetical protein